MKKYVLSSLLKVFVFSICFVSCYPEVVEPDPNLSAETNYFNISGTKYNINSAIENNSSLMFSGTIGTNTVVYPYILIDFGDNPLPQSTITYSGTVKVIKSLAAPDTYEAIRYIKIVVDSGKYSITIPNTILRNNSSDGIVCYGNLTCNK